MIRTFARRLGAALLIGALPCSAGALPSGALAAESADAAAGSRAMLTLDDVIAAARQSNPQIHAALERGRAAAAAPAQAAAYDDPVISWETWNVPESLAVDRADNNIFRVSQKIPFPGKRTLAGKVAGNDAESVARAADTTELDVIAAVTRAYWDFWEAHQRLKIYERDKELVERLTRITEQRYAINAASQSDVLRSQVELTHAVNRLQTQPLAIASAGAELNALLSRAPDAPLGTPHDPPVAQTPPSAERLVDLALRHRPELAQQDAMIARERNAVALARKGYLPDFEVSVGRFVNAGSPNGFGAMLSMTVPLAYRSKYDAGVTAAAAQLSSAEADRRRVEDTIRRDVQQALVRLKTARLQHDLFVTTHIPQAEQGLRVTEGAYQSGAIDFLGLVDSVRMIESAHLEHVQAGAEIGRAYADLERAVGTTLSTEGPAHE